MFGQITSPRCTPKYAFTFVPLSLRQVRMDDADAAAEGVINSADVTRPASTTRVANTTSPFVG
jgi:hypothetical protein